MPQFVVARSPIINIPDVVVNSTTGRKMKTTTRGGNIKAGVARFITNDLGNVRITSVGQKVDVASKPRGRRPKVSTPRPPRSPRGRGRRPRAVAGAPLMFGAP